MVMIDWIIFTSLELKSSKLFGIQSIYFNQFNGIRRVFSTNFFFVKCVPYADTKVFYGFNVWEKLSW